jgi:hypothetical protein
VIWAPNVIWQATHGWPQMAMAAALHQENSTVADYIGGLPAQVLYAGLLVVPLLIAGFISPWRTPEVRFVAAPEVLRLTAFGSAEMMAEPRASTRFSAVFPAGGEGWSSGAP